MLTVYKYRLQRKAVQQLPMPAGAELLDVQVQQGTLCLWTRVPTTNPPVQRFIAMVGTGHEAPAEVLRGPNHKVRGAYIATVQEDGLVWHFFDGGEV